MTTSSITGATTLRHARLVLPAQVVDDGWLRVVGSRVQGLGEEDDDRTPEGANGPELDLGGHWVVPGFVDIHVHGGGGASYMTTDPADASRAFAFHRRHGTTTSMASLVTAPVEEIAAVAATLADLVEQGLLAGIHLEGPFLSRARCGAHDPQLLRSPDADALQTLLDAGRGAIRMVTIAPELPGGINLVKRTVDAGAIAAIGHTNATYLEARAAIDAGASVATHLFNAMRAVHHREPGPVTAALENDAVAVEVINDGVHLDPAVVDLTFRVAGADRVALITDAISAAGMGDGVYPLGSMAVRVSDGVAKLAEGDSIAGSTLTLEAAVRRAVREIGMPITEAVRAAATTPARLLGLADQVGSLEPGKVADLVVLDDDLRVVAVMAAGRWLDGQAPGTRAARTMSAPPEASAAPVVAAAPGAAATPGAAAAPGASGAPGTAGAPGTSG
jgi:N-acetylglucosamine-6-phosphate deacetylase